MASDWIVEVDDGVGHCIGQLIVGHLGTGY